MQSRARTACKTLSAPQTAVSWMEQLERWVSLRSTNNGYRNVLAGSECVRECPVPAPEVSGFTAVFAIYFSDRCSVSCRSAGRLK